MRQIVIERYLFPVVYTGLKNKRLREGIIKGMRTINPEIMDYETEGVMNCFLNLEDAEAAVEKTKKRDPDKKVSVLGLVVTEGYAVPYIQDRGDHNKLDVSYYVKCRTGNGDYTTSSIYDGAETRYMVMGSMLCVTAMFDPYLKENKAVSKFQNPVSKAMGRCMKVLRPQMQKPEQGYIMPQVEQPGASVGWLWWFICFVFGFFMGIAYNRFMERYPLMAAFFLVAGIAGCALAWIIYFSDRK